MAPPLSVTRCRDYNGNPLRSVAVCIPAAFSCCPVEGTQMPARRSPWMDQELEDLRDLARTFCEKEIKPNIETSIKNKQVDRGLWNKAGSLGLLCISIPEEYGGGGGTFAHETVLIEEQAYVGDSA